MGNGASVNSVQPRNNLEHLNSMVKSNILEYITEEEVRKADKRALQITDYPISVENLTEMLSKDSKNNFTLIRSFFKWICNNIRYTPGSKCIDIPSIMDTKQASSEGFANLFEQMCRLSNITVIKLNSFIKNYSFVLHYRNIEDKNSKHFWNAVLINNKYHYVDCSWGAILVDEKLHAEDAEHFLFSSPEIVGDLV